MANNSIGSEIARRRGRMGLSLRSLAFMSGVPHPTIHRLEADPEAGTTIATLTKIADALGVSVGTLIGKRGAA